MKVLIAEDENDLRDVLEAYLTHAGYEAVTAKNGAEALEYSRGGDLDVVVMDIMMPVMDGVEALGRMRQEGNNVPVLLLTAKAEVKDRIAGLDAGADDYLSKPFAMGELLARLRSLTRRGTAYVSDTLRLEEMELDTRRGTLSCVNSIALATRETDLLAMLMRAADRAFSEQEILGRVWKDDKAANGDTVKLYVRYLNGKLQSVGAAFRLQVQAGSVRLSREAQA